MSNAIHMTAQGNTLDSLAGLYFHVTRPDGSVDDIRQKRVVTAIRAVTPTSVTDLTAFTDSQDLGANATIYVPTLRDVNRAIHTDNATARTALASKGYVHARKFLQFTDAQVIGHLTPLSGFTAADVTRAWVLTAFLNLDGMDTYTATYLYDTANITSLGTLASQTVASLDGILTTLTGSPHNRPVQLGQQRHSERWRQEAKILTRVRVNEGRLAKVFQAPIRPGDADALAGHYEGLASSDDLVTSDADLAQKLARLHRFQGALVRGNLAVLGGRWREAVQQYQDARKHFHRLLTASGVQGAIDDQNGVNLNTALDGVKALLDTLPAHDHAPLDAPELRTRSGRGPADFKLGAFQYRELNTSGTDRKGELRTNLSSASIASLPRATRKSLLRSALQKTKGAWNSADANVLPAGLTAGADSYVTRDASSADHQVLGRNLNAATVGKTYVGGSNLDVFEVGASGLPLAAIQGLVGGLWSGLKADDVLATAEKAKYPSAFLADAAVTPFTKFVVIPGIVGASTHSYTALNAGFTASVRDGVLKDRLKSTKGSDLVFADDAWTSAGSFAVIAAIAYCYTIPLGLRKAYTKLGQLSLADRFGSPRLNVYASDGTLRADLAAADVANPAIWSQSTAAGTQNYASMSQAQLQSTESVVEGLITAGNSKYRQGDREAARALYQDALHILEKVNPGIVEQARIANRGVRNAITSWASGTLKIDPMSISSFNVKYDEGGTTKFVLESAVRSFSIEDKSTYNSRESRTTLATQYFAWTSWPPSVTNIIFDPVRISIAPDTALAGKPMCTGTKTACYLDESDASTTAIFSMASTAITKMMAVTLGLDSWGYPDSYIPPWSWDALYAQARELCNQALDMESRVFSLLQALQSAWTAEFQAAQGEAQAQAQVAVATAQQEESAAASALAVTQAEIADEQASMAVTQNQLAAASGLLAFAGALATGNIVGAAGAATGALGALVAQGSLQDIATGAATALQQTEDLASASAATAEAQLNAANIADTQATEYASFLSSLPLGSEGLETLLGLTRDTAEIFLEHANRVSWLAQRALAHETRRIFNYIKTDYSDDKNEYVTMTRAQRLSADLETLRTSYVAGQTVRRQEVKWTIPLSRLQPGALSQLQTTGACAIVLTQQKIDPYFPGLYLHSLKEAGLTFVGTLPAEGVRGVLRTTGSSWVRVPNDSAYTVGGRTKLDWYKNLKNSAGTPTDYHTTYDRYVLKELITTGAALSLSQFDVRQDRAVFQAPQGMLSPLAHIGLDGGLSLKLFRQSNDISWSDIDDVEITFYFLASYDQGLATALYTALTNMGTAAELHSAYARVLSVDDTSQWLAFQGDPLDSERLDLRRLEVDVTSLPPWEASRLVTNLNVALGRTNTSALTLRLLCTDDPVGESFTVGAPPGFVSAQTGQAGLGTGVFNYNATLDAWFASKFYSGSTPTKNPLGTRWVIKLSPSTTGSDWHKRSANGVAVTTTSGPLSGTKPVGTCTATYSNGAAWDNYVLKCRVAHKDGTLRLRVRDSGTGFYALEISPTQVRILKDGTALGSRLLAYPASEFLDVEVKVYNQLSSTGAVVKAHIIAIIDGIEVLTQEDTGTVHPPGTVILEVTNNATGPVPVEFDDVEVYALTALGVEAEQLLSERFTSTLPSTWSFVPGGGGWAISSTGHNGLALSGLSNVSLKIDYRHLMA